MHVFRVVSRILSIVRRSRGTVVWIMAGILAVGLIGNALTFKFFDSSADNPISWADALWYSIISATTIGYGDYSASSLGARLGTIFFIVIAGLLSFSALIGLMADWIIELSQKGLRGMSPTGASQHIIIVNHPGEARVNQVIRELRNDPQFGQRDIVLITDEINEKPAVAGKDIDFVRGSALDIETLEQANIAKAALILVLPISYSNPNSDAVVAATVAVLHRQSPSTRIVAECLDERRKNLFHDLDEQVSVVCGLQIAGNILVQELSDPGVSLSFEEITSNTRGDIVFSTEVTDTGTNYSLLAKAMIDNHSNVISVVRKDDSHYAFVNLTAEPGDRVVYVGPKRLSWGEMKALAQ